MAIPTEPTLSTRMKPIKRAEGRSATKFAAYISGTEVKDERTGEVYDYRNRAGRVEYSELMTPEGAPEWAKDRKTLWNRAEAVERRKDAQTARDFRVGFSYDLTPDQRRDLAREIATHFVKQGMAADLAVHRYSQACWVSDPRTAEKVDKWRKWGIPFVTAEQSKGLNHEHVMVTQGRDGTPSAYRLFQPHCHILLTMRPFDSTTPTGFAGKTELKEKVIGEDGKPVLDKRGKAKWRTTEKSLARQWNDQSQYEGLRGWIAELQNVALADSGSPRRLDPRGYEIRRAEALDLAEVAHAKGQSAEATRQEARAEMLHRQPEPYLGVGLRVKEFTGRVRERFSQWVAVRHANRILPQVEELWQRDHVDFVQKAQHLLELASRSLGLVAPAPVLAPAIGPLDEEHDLER